jgi:predicted proteasome-type protease
VLAKIASATTVKDELPWFKLPRDSILIVPRLGALATSDAFVSEVRARLRTTTAEVEWLATPR